jgi:hypothetical protein
MDVEHRVFTVPGERPSLVAAPGEALMLCNGTPGSVNVRRVNGYQPHRISIEKSAGVVRVGYGAAGEHHGAVTIPINVFIDSYGQMFPMHQVSAYGVSPAHVAPHGGVRIVLVKEMIFSIEVYKTVRVVGPVLCWREVKGRPVSLVIGSGSAVNWNGVFRLSWGTGCGEKREEEDVRKLHKCLVLAEEVTINFYSGGLS